MQEFELVKRISRFRGADVKGVVVGQGDDCAVVDVEGERWLVTTDMLLENVHFNLDFTDTVSLGWKALCVNLSDIAAMGGEAVFYTAAVGVPVGFNGDEVVGLFRGMDDAARRYGLALIGGDTNASKCGLVVSITVFGRAPFGKFVLRSGACVGDKIYVDGYIGESAVGLELLRRGCFEPTSLVAAHLRPEPSMKLGRLALNYATSMIDLSDSLAGNLLRILKDSGVGAELRIGAVPCSDDFKRVCRELSLRELDLLLCGGEDYRLLITVPPEKEKDFVREAANCGCSVSCIGVITKERGKIVLVDDRGKREKVKLCGYEHEF